MKRDPALVSLSRDHHKTLRVAQELRRATPPTAVHVRARFLSYWNTHGRAHFRIEEEVLLPAFAAHGDPYHPLVGRALCDHVAIRQLVDDLVSESPTPPAVMRELSRRLAEHVRLEERELFPLIQRTMP